MRDITASVAESVCAILLGFESDQSWFLQISLKVAHVALLSDMSVARATLPLPTHSLCLNLATAVVAVARFKQYIYF